jgi:hypothetical protein
MPVAPIIPAASNALAANPAPEPAPAVAVTAAAVAAAAEAAEALPTATFWTRALTAAAPPVAAIFAVPAVPSRAAIALQTSEPFGSATYCREKPHQGSSC